MTVRSMTLADLGDVAVVHKAAYRSGQRTAHLPVSLLVRYYRSLLEQTGYCYVALDAETVVGFLVGGRRIDLAVARSRFVRQSAPSLLWTSLHTPQLLSEVIRSGVGRLLRFLQRSATVEERRSAEASETWCLFSIAVLPDYRQGRVARRLVEAFHENLLRDNQLVYEASVLKTNTASQRLFQSFGGVVQREGTGALVYRVAVPAAATEPAPRHPSKPC